MPLTIPENTVSVEFDNGKKSSFLKGTTLFDVLKLQNPSNSSLITLAKMNYRLVSLQEKLYEDCRLSWIMHGSDASMRSCRATLTLLLLRAAKELFPAERLIIDHSLGEGIYCHWRGDAVFKTRDVRALKEKMRSIIAADEIIEPVKLHRREAMEQMRQIGEDPLLYTTDTEAVKHTFFKCGKLLYPMRHPLYRSTGALSLFDVHLWSPGIVLQFPRWKEDLYLQEFREPKKLFNVFQEYGEWEKILGIDKTADLNTAVSTGQIHELIKIAEALHEKKIAGIADHIASRQKDLRLILIAGPSSSGKTTFTKRLNIQLRVNGLIPIVISLDDYFLDRDKTPPGAGGSPDYEALSAIDIAALNRDLTDLLAGSIVKIPKYDFRTGRRMAGFECRLSPGQPVLLEGIHGINDALTIEIPVRSKLKIYVSALTQINIMDHLRVPTSDIRLLRRMVRDVQFRSHTPAETIQQWPLVRRGEEKHIFPYQEDADIIFNSSLTYEPCIIRGLVLPLLTAIPPEDPACSESLRLIELVKSFLPVGEDAVPPNSILGEFTGRSSFSYT